ncbi:peptidase C39 family protein [Candidatus Woesearchaeota archaeon]|nr:peptidase C39 family protein [Candidatus Woesearchaeota archaeon]
MKLNVTFYKQESKTDCGPTALQMVLEYLGEKHPRENLIGLVDSDKSGITWSIGLAKAAAELGFKTEFYTTHLGFNPKNFELDFLKKYADDAQSSKLKLEKLEKQAHKLGVKTQEKNLSLRELLSKISKDCIAIILLDWSKIKGTDSFIGHYVPVVGFDEKNVYVHNQGFHNTKAFLTIERELFNKARKVKGTDEDIIFIHRKNN